MKKVIKTSNRNSYGLRYHGRIQLSKTITDFDLNKINRVFDIRSGGYVLYFINEYEVGVMNNQTKEKAFTIPWGVVPMFEKGLNKVLSMGEVLLSTI
jgi:hypothetical protein